MFKKNTPLKIVLIILITEIIILIGLGIFLKINMNSIINEIELQKINDVKEINIKIVEVSKNIDIILIVSSILFIAIAIVLSIYMSRVIIYPLNKFLKSKDEEKSTEQIEMRKILLHTTEGIICFNRDGTIALINPAAKRLLKISPEENSFDDIFHKFDKNINMERIMYLDN